MGTIRDIDQLQPELAERVKVFLAKLEESKIEVFVLETLRTKEVQAAYYAQGRESLEKVNELRKAEGLYLLSEKENERTVTNTLESRHMSGCAIDICPMKDGELLWSAPLVVWEEIGDIGESCGVDWCAGGCGETWGKGWDNPHFELLKDF